MLWLLCTIWNIVIIREWSRIFSRIMINKALSNVLFIVARVSRDARPLLLLLWRDGNVSGLQLCYFFEFIFKLNVLLVPWRNLLLMHLPQLFRHHRTRENLCTHLIRTLLNPWLRHWVLWSIDLIFEWLSLFKNLWESSAEILYFEVSSCYWALVLLAVIFVRIDPFIVF